MVMLSTVIESIKQKIKVNTFYILVNNLSEYLKYLSNLTEIVIIIY